MNKQHYFLNRADESEQLIYKDLLERLNNDFPVGWDNQIEDFSFIMLKPNAYLSDVIPDIIAKIKANNIEVMAYKLEKLTEEHLDNLYCFIKAKYANSWWVMQKVYSLAPCLVAILKGKKHGYNHLSSRVRSLVGSTTPIISSDATIRYAPYSMTRIFNTIHATDDPASAIREALVFFSKEELLAILTTPAVIKTNELLNNSGIHVPQIKKLTSFAGIKYQLKKSLLEEVIVIIKNSQSNEFSLIEDSIHQLRDLFDKEKVIIDQTLNLREEFYRLAPILNLEKICYMFIDRSAEQSIRNCYRKSNFLSDDQHFIDVISTVRRLIKLLLPLSDDALFFSMNEFEIYLSDISLTAFKLPQFDQAMLLGCWAGALEEMRDISTKWPVEEII